MILLIKFGYFFEVFFFFLSGLSACKNFIHFSFKKPRNEFQDYKRNKDNNKRTKKEKSKILV